MSELKTPSDEQPDVLSFEIMAAILRLSIKIPCSLKTTVAKPWHNLKVGATQAWHDQMVTTNNNRSILKVAAAKSIFIFLNIFPPELT
jgi:hypothetical protein